MFDTINLRLTVTDAGGISFLDETPNYLDPDSLGVHSFRGMTIATGMIGNLHVSCSQWQVKVQDGSFCKWFLGDNFQALTRGDMQRAIEKLSDTLHLPFDRATVTRLDVAQNFILRYPVATYLNHLGQLKGANRLVQPDSLYYYLNGGVLTFYDKVKEQQAKGEKIPELYKGRNVLRYERRFTKRLSNQFGKPVTASTLFDEAFYMSLIKRWQDDYRLISKLNDITINFDAMTSKKQFYKMAALSLIERFGGQTQFLQQLQEAQKQGRLTAKQAFDIRQAVKDACNAGEGLTIPNEAVKELDKKLAEAVRFYR